MSEASGGSVQRLMYISTSNHFLTESALEELLHQARRNNRALGITGMLVYVEGHFLQYLEGGRKELDTLIARIESDPRHSGLIRLIEGRGERRLFSDWSMGFHRLNKDEGEEVLGAINLSRQSLRDSLPCDAPRDLVVLMESFYRSTRGLRPGETEPG